VKGKRGSSERGRDLNWLVYGRSTEVGNNEEVKEETSHPGETGEVQPASHCLTGLPRLWGGVFFKVPLGPFGEQEKAKKTRASPP